MDEIRTLTPGEIPASVFAAEAMPVLWHIRGASPNILLKRLCVVGSRNHSAYGKEVCEYILEGLKDFPISIVSGLALGIDAIAHTTAIKHNIHTVAFPGSSIDHQSLYPKTHKPLAKEILKSGGCIISGFDTGTPPLPHLFLKRNEYMVAWCDAVLIIEGRLKSGTMITANRGADMNKHVFVVPGSIFSEQAEGPHHMLQQGAIPVRSPNDILRVLGLIDESFDFSVDSTRRYRDETTFKDCTVEEKMILSILRTPMSRVDVFEASKLNIIIFNQYIAKLELKGYIQEKYSLFRRTS